CVHFEGNGAKNRHSYPESIRAIQFNRRFLSYGAKVVLKKHLFCGVFLTFFGGGVIPIDEHYKNAIMLQGLFSNRVL
ncbi:hypothetical protein, partial [Escherichia albertii]|uniref:hypothetical protein n=1 Tax=Escherichia albertii TaxID=208962 RepID=UPI001BB1CF7A